MIVLLWALVGCFGDGGDPALRPYKTALDAANEGEALLAADDPMAAAESFARAREARPDDPVLAAWQAHALAEAGENDEAIELLDEVLTTHPGFAEARYNRAAYTVRMGDEELYEDAAADLQRAIDDGARRPRDVLEDPDFEDVIGRAEFAFLPSATLTVGVEVADGPVFWGSDLHVRLRILGAGEGPIGVTAEEPAGPVELVRVVEDTAPSTEGPFRDVRFTFKVRGAGVFESGRLHVWAAGRRTEVSPFRVELTAPPGREEPESELRAVSFTTPRELAGGAEPSARRSDDGSLLVHARTGARIITKPALPLSEAVPYEIRDRNQPASIVWRWWTPPAGPISVKVREKGKMTLDVTVD